MPRWSRVERREHTVINPTWMETFLDLHRARTAPELWGVLVSWHGIRSSSAWEEPFSLFERLHRDDPADAIVTAALLCTDHRWRTASHQLIRRITDSGLLAAGPLDELAEWFLLEKFEIEVAPGPDPSGARRSKSHRRPGGHPARELQVPGDRAGSTVRRPTWPPLRRWAARHLVQRSPERWRDLFAFAGTLPSRDGAAVAAGVMDATNHLPSSDRSAAVALGLTSGSGTVRLAALPALATLQGDDAALTRARSDTSATVRDWTPRVASDPSAPSTPPAPTPRPPDDLPNQLDLF